jgi:hypothetical protein
VAGLAQPILNQGVNEGNIRIALIVSFDLSDFLPAEHPHEQVVFVLDCFIIVIGYFAGKLFTA